MENTNLERKYAGAPEGNQNAVKHGVYTNELVALTEQKRQEVIELIKGTRTAIAKTDSIAVELLARNLAKIQLFDDYLEKSGFFFLDDKGNTQIQPLLKIYWQALNSATRLCTALGLTTESRLRLGLELARSEDALERIQKAKKTKDDNAGTDK